MTLNIILIINFAVYKIMIDNHIFWGNIAGAYNIEHNIAEHFLESHTEVALIYLLVSEISGAP